jgi:CheY-like chemotaxis protein
MSKKVLVVEDYKDTREVLKFVLERKGYQVLEASNGSEAVETVQKESPDLIFMDMALPEMDGITATEIIRSSSDNSEIPIVAITAHGNFLSDEATKAGCNKVINKPLDFVSLEVVLKQYLGTDCD